MSNNTLYKSKFNAFSIILIGFFALSTLSGCKSEKTEPEAVQKVVDPNLVELTPELQQQIKTAKVDLAEIRETLRIPGSIQVNEQREARVGAPVTGRITEIQVMLGQQVKQGQVLAQLNSTELAQNQLTYIKAAQQISLQTKAVERAKLLLESDVIGAAELQRREAELNAARADLNAARDQLMILGMSKQAIAKIGAGGNMLSVSNVSSRIDGTVIERKARLGQVVQPAEELFVVADLSHVWAVAEVPERQIELIQKEQDVTIEIPALNNKQITGKLIFVGDVVNPETRTVTVRTDLDNVNRNLKPDMLVSMLLQSQNVKEIAVPFGAIVRENDKDHVFVSVSGNQYRLREVSLGTEYEGMVAIKGGLDQGETIITDGAFHVNNERKRKELE